MHTHTDKPKLPLSAYGIGRLRLGLVWLALAWATSAGAQEATEPVPTPVQGQDVSPALGEGLEPGEALEQAVSGLGYHMGPGDVLSINIWSPQPITHQLVITPEGKLLIPYVGEIDVNHLLLADAKALIRRELLKNYRNVDITITLISLRKFQIHVLGQVKTPGAYLASAVDRVSTMISRAHGFQENANQRHILIQNGDSTRTTADLYAFLRRGIGDQNPFVTDGDRIFVPFANDFVSVFGQVNAPGRLQFLNGDKLSDIILLSGGFSGDAYLDTIEVARYPEGATDPIRFFAVNGGDLVPARPEDQSFLPQPMDRFSPPGPALPLGKAPSYVDFKMQPDDVVFVRRVPEARLRRFVEIQGEVTYPGNYPIEEGKTLLSDLVEWSGGLSADANLAEAKLVRRGDLNLEDAEFERLKKMQVADMKQDEYGYFKMKSRQLPGQMVVNFERALVKGDPHENVLLQRGDLVIIPSRKDYVGLLGEVAHPGNVAYRPGLNASGYIRAAGGFSDKADKGDTRVIKAGTGQWMKTGEAGKLSPGDVVFVPEKEPKDFWRHFRETLTVAAQLAAIYLVVDTAARR
jgi:protein involved in polysaccharide export with SLBB domain